VANRAAGIRASLLAAHPEATVVERGERHIVHRLADLGGRPRFALDASIGALHYQDAGGVWQEIDDDLVDDGAEGFTVKTAATPYLLRADGAGKRRLYPNRHDLTRYIELGGLPALGTPQRGPNYLLWDRPNFAVRIRTAPETLKFVAILKNASAPTSFSFDASLVGLMRQGQLLLADGVPVARIRKPSAVDAEGIEREAAISFAGGKITVSLDTTGLVFPIELDPTIEVSVDAGANDYVTLDGVLYSDDPALSMGQNAAGSVRNIGALFPSVTIPASRTASNCYIQLVAAFANTETICNVRAYGNDTVTPAAPTTQAEFDALVKTTKYADWSAIPAWTAATSYNSPDLSEIVQELLNSYDYSSGAYMQFMLYNNGSSVYARRRPAAFEHTTYAPPLLHIEYSTGGVNASIDAVVATAAAAAPIATVTTTRNVSIEALPATAAAAVPLPAVSTGVTVSIEAVPATADAAAPIPAVSISVTISAVVASAGAAAPIPAVATVRNVSVDAVVATADAAAPVPAISVTGTVSIEAVAATAGAAAPIPTVTVVRHVSVAAVTATAAAAAPVPTISVGVAITAVAASASAAAPIPALSVGVTISAVAAAAIAAALAPSIGAAEWQAWPSDAEPIVLYVGAALYPAATVFYLEAYVKTNNAAYAVRIRLYNATDGEDIADSEAESTETTLTRLRSSSFALPSPSKNYYLQFGGDPGATYNCKGGRVIAEWA